MPEISEQDHRTFVRLQDIAAKYEGADGIVRKIEKLEKDNGGYRDQIRDLESKVPKDGTAVVPKADAEELEKFRALGKPDDLKAGLDERDTLKAEAARRTHSDALREAGKAAYGSDAAGTVLDRIKGSENWKVEMRQEGEGDTKKSVPYVVTAEGEKPVSLSSLVEGTYPELLPALKAEAPKGGAQGGRAYPEQRKEGGASEPADPVEARIKRMNEQAAAKTNPLLGSKATT